MILIFQNTWILMMGTTARNIVLIPVVTPSGATVEVMSQDEADFYNDRRERYVTENKFQNVSQSR